MKVAHGEATSPAVVQPFPVFDKSDIRGSLGWMNKCVPRACVCIFIFFKRGFYLDFFRKSTLKWFKSIMNELAGRTQKQLIQFLSRHHVMPSLLFFSSCWGDVTVGLWMWHIHTHTHTYSVPFPGAYNGRKADLDRQCGDGQCHHVLYA